MRKAKQVRLVNQTKHFTLRVDNKVRLCSAISSITKIGHVSRDGLRILEIAEQLSLIHI